MHLLLSDCMLQVISLLSYQITMIVRATAQCDPKSHFIAIRVVKFWGNISSSLFCWNVLSCHSALYCSTCLFDYHRVMIALMIRLPPRNADDAREGKLTRTTWLVMDSKGFQRELQSESLFRQIALSSNIYALQNKQAASVITDRLNS